MSRWGSAVVAFRGLSSPQALLGSLPVETVFTRAERLRSGGGRTLQHWAGRLAAKYAVLQLLDVPADADALGAVEVLPELTPLCARNAACLHGHPPGVRLGAALAALPGADARVRVSVSHTADLAFAAALTAALLPEDHDLEAVSAWT